MPAPPLPTLRAAGCDEAEAALTRYQHDAGTTTYSRADAALQARHDLTGAWFRANGNAVGPALQRLSADFGEYRSRLIGEVMADPNEVIGWINSDTQELRGRCG
ncbi:hypothetical protein [Kitasatospora sp. NPDC002040]|uniref:hypothetical protein n=1 Tax=Kitasatospora sp. NPDC002040 TaxID=3154661 RepID=UPI003332DBC2